MKKILLALLLVAGVTTVVHAVGYGNVQNTTTAAGQLITLGGPQVTPTTYTAGTCVPQQVVIKKITLAPVTAGTASSFALWDCPSGLTYSTGAKLVLPTMNLGTSFIGPMTLNFATTDGGIGADPQDGLFCKYFPVIVNSSTNTLNAVVEYVPFTGPIKIIPH